MEIRTTCERAGRAADACDLLAVVKYQPDEVVRALYELGQTRVAENRVQALAERDPGLLERCAFELIGHLQTNKARRARAQFRAFHGLDSVRLAEQLGRAAGGDSEPWPVYLQVNLSDEAQKHGCSPEELPVLAQSAAAQPGLRVVGLMTMAAFDAAEERIRATFAGLRSCSESLRSSGELPEAATGLSMGMTQDFRIAVEEGATIVRVGSALFEGVLCGKQPVG